MTASKQANGKVHGKVRDGHRKQAGASAASMETIDKVFAYNLDPVLERYVKDQDISEEDARQHERELKRYFSLVIDNDGTVYGMCGPVDKLWHTFLMYTARYQEFCSTVAGRFLHHFPNDNAGNRSKADAESYKKFVRDYSATFGEAPPRHIWPSAMTTGTGVAVCSTCACCIAVGEEG